MNYSVRNIINVAKTEEFTFTVLVGELWEVESSAVGKTYLNDRFHQFIEIRSGSVLLILETRIDQFRALVNGTVLWFTPSELKRMRKIAQRPTQAQK